MQSSATPTVTAHHDDIQDSDGDALSNNNDAQSKDPSSPTLDALTLVGELVEQNGDIFVKELDGGLIPVTRWTPGEHPGMPASIGFEERSALEELHEQEEPKDHDVTVEADSRSFPSREEPILAVIGNFETAPGHVEPLNFVAIPVHPVQLQPPSAAGCLTSFDMDGRDNNLRVMVDFPRVDGQTIIMRLGTQGNRIIYNIGASFMWVTPSPQVQTGTIEWRRGMAFTRFISWNFFVNSTPTLFLGIQAIDVSDNYRVTVAVDFVGNQGFQFTISTWGSVELHSCRLQWIASFDPRVRAGEFEGRGSSVQRIDLTGLSQPPQVMLGITSLDLRSTRGVNARVRLTANDISRDGFNVRIQTWSNSEIYALAGRYLASVL